MTITGIPLPPTVQGSQEWLDQRRGGIGGSDVAALMMPDEPGKLSWSPFGGPNDVWASKVRDYDGDTSIAMECGNYLEPLVMRELAKACQREINTDVETSFCHPKYDWCRGSLDGLVLDEHGEVIAGAEGKTSSDFSWPDGPPIYYVAQVQWYMFVLGLDQFYLGCIFAKNAFDWWIIERDEAFIESLFLCAMDFWLDYVEPAVAPPADWSHAAVDNILNGRTIVSNPKTREPLSDELDALLNEREALLAEAGREKERVKTINALIMAGMTHKRHEGSAFNVTMVQKTGLDRKALEAAHPDAWADCVESRVVKTVSVKLLKARYPELVAAHTGIVNNHLRTTVKK